MPRCWPDRQTATRWACATRSWSTAAEPTKSRSIRTRALKLADGAVEEIIITPEDAGLARAPLSVVTGGDATENAARLRALLDGAGEQAERDIVALNTGALLMTAGRAATLREGVAAAADALGSGAAGKVLDAFVESSRG